MGIGVTRRAFLHQCFQTALLIDSLLRLQLQIAVHTVTVIDMYWSVIASLSILCRLKCVSEQNQIELIAALIVIFASVIAATG